MPWFPKDKTTRGIWASESCPPELLPDAFDLISECVEQAYYLEPDREQMCKKYVLTLIGLWGKRYQHTWRVTTSRSEDDRLGALFKSVELPDGCLELYTRSETITNVSMLPTSSP